MAEIEGKEIDQLTEATTISDEDLFVLRQEGQAMKLRGNTLRKYAEDNAKTVSEGIWADLPQVNSVKVTKGEGTVTIDLTLEDGSTSKEVITLDENDYPVSIVTDGVTCPITWEGFDV